MAAAQPNPTDLSHSTKLPPPSHKRNFSKSRSPSRSPSRKAQFAARELDPLLKNLSPDSTLEALQEADVLGGSQAEQNAIARSISDASESERKLGIRAAVTAKKLKEWTEEVTAWSWPSPQDRAWGAGFIPKHPADGDTTLYFGCLPQTTVKQYEDRLDEVWDAIETLGMDEIKDYVFSSHHPTRRTTDTSSYGRMRDFTALITATIIQALPVLANLHLLLETWSIRLTILRQIPDLLSALDQMKLGLKTINDIVKDEEKSKKLNKRELDTGKVMFGNKVSNLGKRVDNLLDILEGQEDRLPQSWIDSLEDIENKYAEWVAQAEQTVLRNDMVRPPSSMSNSKNATPIASPARTLSTALPPTRSDDTPTKLSEATATLSDTPSNPKRTSSAIKRKPLLEVNSKAGKGHRRGPSEISVADSVISGYSENPEIVDATATPVLPSPRVSVIDSQLPIGKSAASWMHNDKGAQNLLSQRPGMIQRASTASIEVIPKDTVRKVQLRKSASYDMLAARKSPLSNPVESISHSTVSSSQHEQGSSLLLIPQSLTPLAVSPSPSLRVDPLSVKGRELAEAFVPQRPLVPRRSSKRLSMPLLSLPERPITPPEEASENTPDVAVHIIPDAPKTPPSKVHREETFDDKLKTILASMPTKFRLTEGSDSSSSEIGSETSSRASSPTRVLKLSPVKDTKSSRNNTTTGIRIYHLRGGRSKDAPPLKLFVRAVGQNGERIMVRVGGGWADLAEYLKEYSLHHGSRGLSEQNLEVAGFPVPKLSQGASASNTQVATRDAGFDFGLTKSRSRSEEEKELQQNLENSPWRPPPMPIMANNHNVPIARSTSPNTERALRSTTPTPSIRQNKKYSTITNTTPVTTTTTTTPNNRYTPLGGAGPAQSNRRATSSSITQSPANEAWVEGMVNQARAVSNSHPNHQHTHATPSSNPTQGNRMTTPTPSHNNNNNKLIQTPTTTTTTTIISSKPRNTNLNTPSTSRRISSWSTTPSITPVPPPPTTTTTSIRPSAVSSPQGSQISNTSSGSSGSYATATTSRNVNGTTSEKKKSRMSLGDVGGIRRVFLRKRSDR